MTHMCSDFQYNDVLFSDLYSPRALPSGIHITTLRVQIPYTLETHGTADLYHDLISQCFPDSWGSLATAKVLVVLATIHPRVYGEMKGCARVYGE